MNKKLYTIVGLAMVMLVAAVAAASVDQSASQATPSTDDQSVGQAIADGGVAPSTAISKTVQKIKLPNVANALTVPSAGQLLYTNVNYVAAGLGVRNTGRGTISLRVPAGTTLVDAWLYWQVLDSSTAPNGQDAYLTVNGIKLKGSLIGSGPTPCWGAGTDYAYRANLKSILTQTSTQGGEYGILIGGINAAKTSGPSPWDSFALVAAENVNAVILYGQPNVNTLIVDGYAEFSGGLVSQGIPAGANKLTTIWSDGQVVGITPYIKSVTYNNPDAFLLQQVTLNGKDPSITSQSTYRGSLSDTDTFVLPSTAGDSAQLSWNLANDCLGWQATIFTNAPGTS